MKTSKQKLEDLLTTPGYKKYLNEQSLATNLAVQFKMHRETCKLSQVELSKMMGVQQSTVARLESGAVGISTSTLQKFCSAMNLKLNFENYKEVIKNNLSDPMDVAKYITEVVQLEFKECYDLTHLKLQKLLYYVQLHYFGQFLNPIIEHDFQAWEHGPVCPKIYNEFKNFKDNIVFFKDVNGDSKKLTDNDRELIEFVVSRYAKFSAWELRQKTHSEMPWKNARKKGINTLISLNDMKLFYDITEVLT